MKNSLPTFLIGMSLVIVSGLLMFFLGFHAKDFLDNGGYIQTAVIYLGAPVAMIGIVYGVYLVVHGTDPMKDDIDSTFPENDTDLPTVDWAVHRQYLADAERADNELRAYREKQKQADAYRLNDERRFADTIVI